ncbi:MAG: PQQ-dependent dehydrogenase, methanol/ethanol family, partial [Betaproteobacteria bacterium]
MKVLSRHSSVLHITSALIALSLLGTAAVLRAEVTNDMLLNAAKETDNWRMVGRDYAGTRFSPLKQVNAKNIKRLVPKWTFSLGTLDAQNTTPLV